MNIRLRKANESDCRFLYDWRNHPIARQFSHSKEEIVYADHEKWFMNSLKNPDRTILIALDGEVADENKARVGQIRFDKKDSQIEVLVSVTVDPEKFGMGYGTEIIKKGTEEYLAEHPEVERAVAEVLKNNPASVRVFEKAGYRRVGEDENQFEYCFKRN
jgi:RimJ/RimL family protein N-acetyltransferase